MQATVFTFDAEEQTGTLLTDNGRRLTFSAAAFASSGLRSARPGQRMNIEVGADGISRMWIVGIGAGQRIR